MNSSIASSADTETGGIHVSESEMATLGSESSNRDAKRIRLLQDNKQVNMLAEIRSTVSKHGRQLGVKFDKPETRRKEALRFFNEKPQDDDFFYFNFAMWISFALLTGSLIYYVSLHVSITVAETEESVKYILMGIFYAQNVMEHCLHAFMRRKRESHFYLMTNVTVFVLMLNCLAMAFCGWARYTYSSLLSCGEFVGYMLLTQFSLVVTTNEIMLCKRFYDTAFGLFLREKVPLQMLPVPLEITREQQGVTETFEIPYGFDDINDEQKKNLKENLLIAYDKLKAQVQIMQWKFYANLFIFVVTTSVSYFYFYIECFITFPSATILYMVYAIFVVQYCVALQILSVNRRVKKLEEQFFIKSHLGVHLKGWKPREELLFCLIVTFGITTFSLLGKLAKNGKFQQSDDC
jgi:hypothetical protein